MKKFYIFIVTTGILLNLTLVKAQTLWTGSTLVVTKTDFADWTQEANQDRITANVWLTRADNRGIFNIVLEAAFDNVTYTSPLDTEWANGSISDGIGSLTFGTWDSVHGANPPSLVGEPLVLHLITDDIYIDIMFTSWTSGGAGGGFTYERSTDQALSSDSFEMNRRLNIYPNPSSEFIRITNIINSLDYEIYDMLGARILEGTIRKEEEINIQHLPKGVYFMKLNNKTTRKFIRN